MFHPQAIPAVVSSACALASLPGRLFCHRDACGLFHSHTPGSVAAAIATAARLVALRISLRKQESETERALRVAKEELARERLKNLALVEALTGRVA